MSSQHELTCRRNGLLVRFLLLFQLRRCRLRLCTALVPSATLPTTYARIGHTHAIVTYARAHTHTLSLSLFLFITHGDDDEIAMKKIMKMMMLMMLMMLDVCLGGLYGGCRHWQLLLLQTGADHNANHMLMMMLIIIMMPMMLRVRTCLCLFVCVCVFTCACLHVG